MRLDRDVDAAALVAQDGVTADSAAVIRLSGDAGRAYRIRLPRRDQADWRELSIWSANDGAIAPRCAAGRPGERDRAVALRCTHMGFTYDPQVIMTLLRELEITHI